MSDFDYEQYLMRSIDVSRNQGQKDREHEELWRQREWAFRDALFTYRQHVLGWSSEELYYGRSER